MYPAWERVLEHNHLERRWMKEGIVKSLYTGKNVHLQCITHGEGVFWREIQEIVGAQHHEVL